MPLRRERRNPGRAPRAAILIVAAVLGIAASSRGADTDGCDCPAAFRAGKLRFTTATSAARCGEVRKAGGDLFRSLDCGGLYIGGGGNTVPLPIIVPPETATMVRVSSCRGTSLDLRATDATESGDDHSCTKAGCFLGPPMPVRNESSPPASFCFVTRWAADASGSADCRMNEANLDMSLAADVYLSGDLIPSLPGIQPCPLCLDGACRGGPNDGKACVVGSHDDDLTSTDCLPPAAMRIGQLVGHGTLTTKTIRWTAVPTGSEARAFCGFCRETRGRGAFRNPPVQCLEDGVALGQCGPAETCEQGDNGAFGLAGGGASTITLSGAAPVGSLADGAPHAGTLATLFCIPPTTNPTINAAASLPSAGALSIAGTFTLEGGAP